MKFLIDADLPYSLKEIFIACGLEALHVRDVDLNSASDEEIFDYAAEKWLYYCNKRFGIRRDIFETGWKRFDISEAPALL